MIPILTKSTKSSKRENEEHISEDKNLPDTKEVREDEDKVEGQSEETDDPFALFSSVTLHHNEAGREESMIYNQEDSMYTSVAYTITSNASPQKKAGGFLKR